ncbi:MAG: EamA family transporter [Kiritimatiellae bacterium]|nr:EamA family transporter [Kiritimatiellia bacterium]
MNYIYILLTLLFTVYGQLVLKWQISKAGALPNSALSKFLFLLQQFLNPWILSGFIAAFLASLCWMAAMTKFELNEVYPFMSLAFVLIMLFSVVFLGESISLSKIVGTGFIVLGLIILAQFSG